LPEVRRRHKSPYSSSPSSSSSSSSLPSLSPLSSLVATYVLTKDAHSPVTYLGWGPHRFIVSLWSILECSRGTLNERFNYRKMLTPSFWAFAQCKGSLKPHKERERERERDRQTDRQTNREDPKPSE
jgi:hypothetical protein